MQKSYPARVRLAREITYHGNTNIQEDIASFQTSLNQVELNRIGGLIGSESKMP